MGFQDCNGILRKIGRRIVLPEKEIKSIVEKEILSKSSHWTVFDFGAGTLGWSKWFKKYADKVYAIDIIYENGTRDNIDVLHSVDDVKDWMLDGCDRGGVLWLCDVLHHVETEFSLKVIDWFINPRYIVIKDVDCRHRFGNFMNRLHDRVINGENARDVDPVWYERELKKRGYNTKYYYFRKLWYPHFLIVGEKIKHVQGEK